MFNLEPAPGYILVKPHETKSDSPFQVSDDATKNYSGKVVAVGKDNINEHGVKISTEAKVDDVIIHSAYHVEVNNTDGTFRFVPMNSVVGFIKEK